MYVYIRIKKKKNDQIFGKIKLIDIIHQHFN